MNRKERERFERKEKLKGFIRSIFTLLLNLGFFAIVVTIVFVFLNL